MLDNVLYLHNLHHIILLATCRNFLIVLLKGGCQDIIIRHPSVECRDVAAAAQHIAIASEAGKFAVSLIGHVKM